MAIEVTGIKIHQFKTVDDWQKLAVQLFHKAYPCFDHLQEKENCGIESLTVGALSTFGALHFTYTPSGNPGKVDCNASIELEGQIKDLGHIAIPYGGAELSRMLGSKLESTEQMINDQNASIG